MSLQFNPGAYLAALQFKREKQQQDNQAITNPISQGIQGIAQYQQSQEQKQQQQRQTRMEQLLAGLKFKEQGIDPTAGLNYIQTGQFPQSPAQSPNPSMAPSQPMFGNSLNPHAIDFSNPMGIPGSGQMASAGTPDTGWPTSQPSASPRPIPPSPTGGMTSIFQGRPTDFNSVISDLKNQKYDSFNGLNEKDKGYLKELPAYKSLMTDKSSENYTPEQAQALMSGNPQRVAAAFPNGVPKSAISPAVSAAGAEGRNKYFGARGSATFLNELPSNTSPSEPAGAAYAVKVAVRQGQSLINQAGSPQAIALAASDLARAVQRSAPQMDVIRGGGFSDNFIQRLNMIKQKFTADPQGTVSDVPKVRQEIFNMLTDLDKSAQPWIDNKLKDIESTFPDQLPQDWAQVKSRQRGETLTPVKFDDGSGNTGTQQIGRFKVTVR